MRAARSVGESRNRRSLVSLGLSAIAVLCSLQPVAFAQAAASSDAQQNQSKARDIVNEMVEALGGPKWLTLKNSVLEGRLSGFSHGKPTGAIINYREIGEFPDKTRVEFGKKGKWVQIFDGRQGWEITYRGKRDLPADQISGFLRRRDHSIAKAVRIWMKDPQAILVYGGQNMAGRHLTDQVTVISAKNDSLEIQTDAQTHLPLRISWAWRDPVYHDKDTEAIEYSDYHSEDGIATPFGVAIFRNDEMVSQRWLYRASYDVALPPETFNPDQAAAKIKH